MSPGSSLLRVYSAWLFGVAFMSAGSELSHHERLCRTELFFFLLLFDWLFISVLYLDSSEIFWTHYYLYLPAFAVQQIVTSQDT